MDTLETSIVLDEPELEVAVEDDDRDTLLLDELRDAIRRKLAPADGG
jgi:hypothetical protein